MSAQILVVEDEGEFNHLVKEEIEHLDLTVDVAHSGEEGLEKILKGNYRLVVSDIKMEGMTGVEMAEKALDQMQDPPTFFIMSGFTELSTEQIISKGTAKFFEKPMELDDLFEAIDFFFSAAS
ncbi:MAG: hypothetical protein CL677_03475 [Bdellovibrionaceae bacterium]|nr:hypothetical protein [Pseudobdellovibrionaceae bacterium]|tara:strand:- start:90 stop:458 length:369 start_codon:yes stop_codon:yes gene_type:complete